MMRLHVAAAVCLPLALAGCATPPKDIAPDYVPTTRYQEMSCKQLRIEAQNVSASAAGAVGAQQQKADNDRVMMGVGLVVFWPALLFMKGNGYNEQQVAQLKGQMTAIQSVSDAKHCGIVFQQQ
jgi:hypothetical protein